MSDYCKDCPIEDCKRCPLAWNDDPTESEVIMLFD
jgi:hypothetical protein